MISYIMMPGSKGLSPHELAHRWVKDLRTRPDMRMLGRIVGVRSTEQSVGIKVGGFCPRHHIMENTGLILRLLYVKKEEAFNDK